MRSAHVCLAIAAATLVAARVANVSASPAAADPRVAVDAAALLATGHRVEPNIVYLSLAGWSGKLDIYLPRHPEGPLPTAILFHGGGWVTGSKDEVALDALPYLAMGLAVVNVDYRLARVALAPAAIEDSRCALRWVIRHATQYGLDPAKIVLVGSSAGGHLALMAGFVPASAGFDRLCPGNEPMQVAAIVNFFGIVDVREIFVGPHRRDFAIGWLGMGPDRDKLAARVSPITYVGPGAPPVLTLHGDADPVVPFEQARRLQAALDRAGIPNRLVSIRAGRHGDFDGEEVLRATHLVREFLAKRGIIKAHGKLD